MPRSYQINRLATAFDTRVVRLGFFIATSGDLVDQPRVADAVSDLFRDIFGIEKSSVRAIIGVASLPLGVPIALHVIFKVANQDQHN